MLHIRVIFLESNEIANILTKYGLQIRQALHVNFPQYSVEEIAIIAEPLLEWKVKLSDNLLPLEFVIDIGKQSVPLDESHSEHLRDCLLSLCPKLDNINFGIWLKEMPSDGFSEHKPTDL